MLPKTYAAGADKPKAVLEHLRSKLPTEQAQAITPFASQYFHHVDPDDLAETTLADLCGSVVSHWHFAEKYVSGSKIRVFNPQLEEHGWESTHTIIEIVSEDMPFLIDSIGMEVNRQGLTLHLIVHPTMKIVRDAKGKLLRLAEHQSKEGRFEAIIHIEVDRRTEAAELKALQHGLEAVLADVHKAVEDWPAMRQRLQDILAEVDRSPLGEGDETAETKEFLKWLAADNFVLLGCRDYKLLSKRGEHELLRQGGSGLGILRDDSGDAPSKSFAALPPDLKAQALQPTVMTISKSTSRSTVHRNGYLDLIGIRSFDAKGRVVGERRLLGLLTSTAYNANPARIPLLRQKLETVIDRAGFLPKSHAAKALLTILEQYPRDELFQISVDELFSNALGIQRLGERQRTRLFLRFDPFGRFVSCLVFVPREKYNTEQRQRMQAVLMEAFSGTSSEFDVSFSESALARVLITVRTTGLIPQPADVRDIENQLIRATRRWEDDLLQNLLEHCGEERGMALYNRYAHAFPAGYREDYAPRMAVHDIEQIESLNEANPLAMSLYVPIEAPPNQLRFKILRRQAPVLLSTGLPMIERMGVTVIQERPAKIEPVASDPIWLHDFGLTYEAAEPLDIDHLRPLFQDAFLRAWRGEIENDDFNRLTLLAGLSWREISILRAYARHMRQATFTFSLTYMEQTLASHPQLAKQLTELFRHRFDPALTEDREASCAQRIAEMKATLDQVSNLDEDRILRQFLAMILATVRTNFYQAAQDGQAKSYISFKFDPSKIPNLPEPRPMFEIFVYSPRLEGVHLRGGKVARGGLRWSDRMEDFRTEVLGLVKAQMVKNAVIVPVGSKGGFVVKNSPPASDREAFMAEGIACYQTYLRGLLDLTDNLVAGQVVPPPQVVRHDEDDPYLVVAADKGTASFSDYANAISAEYNFWLGDAFASGGSLGYDHKKMGITARGAWESVKRSFRELGLNTQKENFAVVGIGDMSGDVFGNGMLLSKHIRLIAAFDHRHIFLDPDPDSAKTFAERDRLFKLPRSSWDDFDKSLISEGGGVWPRSAKSIKLSPQIRAVLGIDAESLPPVELIRAILTAPVDLLYNGGIGTYVKAASETNGMVGDRANDAIRINGNELRCRVVGEGGNLGFTQLGRIEFALKGGKIYTDAIDNSGGVDCSDHEVNIKILLNAVVAEGDLTEKQRNKLLAEMTDEVAALVLRDNYFQSQIISVTRSRGIALSDEQARYARKLANAGRLNRKLEYLPFDEEIAERKAARIGLVAPELSVMLAYSKIELFDALLASNVPEDEYISTALSRYFPQPLRERYSEQILRHPLKREIVATHVVNSMINRVGSTFVSQLQEETGAASADIVRAYLATREVFGLVSLWQDIEALDNQVADGTQTAMITDSSRLIQRGTLWFLRNRQHLENLSATLARFTPGVAQLSQGLYSVVVPEFRSVLDAIIAHYGELGVPEVLARRLAILDELYSALDLVEVAEDTGRPTALVAQVYFTLGGRLDMHWLGQQITTLPTETHWQSLARTALRDDLSTQARNLTAEVLKRSPDSSDAAAMIASWESAHPFQLDRYRQLFTDIKSSGVIDMPMLSVILRELRSLV